MVRISLFVKVPRAYKRIVLNHYEGEVMLHDCDHLPYCYKKVHSFEMRHGVKSIYAFRPKFVDYLAKRTVNLDSEQLCAHFDGDTGGFERFCSKLEPMWINGHDRFNKDTATLTKYAEEFSLKMLKPVVFSDYSWRGDIVEGFLRHKGEAGLFNFHLDYFWPLFMLM
jgi:hypothetical protein